MLPTRPSRVLVATLALALVAIACNGVGNKATYINTQRSFSLFALTGAPVNAPTALAFLGGATIADASFGFDVAIDIDSLGVTRLYPVRTLAGGLAGTPKRVGLQLVSGTYEALREAPATGYDTLGSKVVTTGSVVAVELQDFTTCVYSIGGTNLYAKLVIDSIRTDARRIFGRTVIDPNCGFRELLPDSLPQR